jgi:hypothetical protein
LLLFKNTRNGKQIRFERIAAAPNSGLAIAIPARGLAIADLDNDGREDAVLANEGATPTLLRNVAESKNNWLSIKLVGDVSRKTPKDAIGSTILLTAGNLTQRFDLIGGAGYASQNEQIIHIGLGENAKISSLEVVWSNGQREKFSIDKINTRITLKQNAGVVNQ